MWPAIPFSDEFSSLRHSPTLEKLNKATTLLALPQGKKRLDISFLRRKRRQGGTRILTGFPLRVTPLGLHLGPAYSWPTTRCQENLALATVGILTRLRCYYHRDLHWGTVHRISRPCFYPTPTPTYHKQGNATAV
jgi:hypothetical protein